MCSLSGMNSIRAACVRIDLWDPTLVETLSNSVMGLVDNAGRAGRTENLVFTIFLRRGLDVC